MVVKVFAGRSLRGVRWVLGHTGGPIGGRGWHSSEPALPLIFVWSPSWDSVRRDEIRGGEPREGFRVGSFTSPSRFLTSAGGGCDGFGKRRKVVSNLSLVGGVVDGER